MDKIKLLQVKKLLKELDFIESDYEYRSEVISDADSEFIKSINDFLIHHPDLKEVYDSKINETIDKTIKKSQEEAENIENTTESNTEETEQEKQNYSEEDNTQNESKEPISQELKRIYREIVKLTHPDKIKKKKLNDLYIKATQYYESHNKIGLFKICDELGIYYDLQEEDEGHIYKRIYELKQKINFLESTFTWKWFNSQSDEEKNQILINYIKLRIK